MAKKELIYVLAKDGTPLMPTMRKRKINKLVASGKARVLETVLFVVQLLYDTPKEIQPATIAPDCGRTNLGLAIVDVNGKPLMLLSVLTRNQEIRKLMQKRSAYRRASRMGERKARQRLAKKHHTMFAAGVKMRKLPQCEELITCNYIINTEARFCNRKRPVGWLTPTATQLLRTHINIIKKLKQWIPIDKIAIEVNRFAFAAMENPKIFGDAYRNGPLKGFVDVEDFIYHQQDGICLFCKEADIEEYHHIIPTKQGGSESHENRAGLCKKCHELVQNNKEADAKLKSMKAGVLAKYKGVSVLNQIVPFFIKEMIDMFGSKNVFLTDGKTTAETRDSLGYIKDENHPCHVLDAYLIACNALKINQHDINNEMVYFVKQYRRHDRANVKAQTERTYKIGPDTVAKNRNKRMDQKGDSLHEFRLKQITKLG